MFPWGWLLLPCAVMSYETWHLVDVAQVVCPAPTVSDPDAPPYPEYNLGINYTSDMDENAPHIVTFIRSSQKAMSISFKIEDATGKTVVAETTVNLQELSSSVPSSCQCSNPAIPTEVEATYGANYGKQCQAWDEAKCAELWGNVSVGSWCCRPWCYASSECPDAYSSSLLPDSYFSYAACNSFAPTYPCQWTEVAKANDPCTCKDASGIFSADMLSRFDANYGSFCSTWDLLSCSQNYRPDQVDTWCCASWCYVDKECPSAIASLNAGMEGKLYWSDQTCVDDPGLVAQCPYKPQPNISAGDTRCDCLGLDTPSYILEIWGVNATEHADYGKMCAPHDASICELTYPGADHDLWCCESWCWVDPACPTSRASTVFPSRFWSTSKCALNADVMSGCKYNLDACACRGQLPNGSFPGDTFAADYGSSCKAWDSVGCKDVWYHNPDSGWNSSDEHEWCCDSWCYVNYECPIAKQSWLGIGYYFSYETCDDPVESYNESTDVCEAARRLQPEEDDDIRGRRLSGRRRGGSSWSSSSRSGSSSWSSRRRSPPAPPTNPRRRSASAPSFFSPRRRAPVSPRRRDIRRRAPPPPVPTPLNSRRRTTGMNGQTYYAGTGGNVPYGYSSRPQLMNNYGGTMPYQTPYGYSGYNAYPPDSNANIAMYGAGGFVLGAGSMHAYNTMYGDPYRNEIFSRRRFYGFYSPNYCTVLDESTVRYGDFMECEQCFRLYGPSFCPSGRSCRTATGCNYKTTRQYNRDDLAATGFIPADFTFPLKVVFTSITGPDIDTDPISGICPARTLAQAELIETFNKTMSFRPDLFLVLTKQQILADPNEAGSGYLPSLLTPGLMLLCFIAVM
mmetsp:Transcript_19719/g.45930  ORF Transcript_19719/g.45930 Transcript_19719/m.45930 type:complete len:850 (+) Transcript_19719:82-2631(+)